MRRRARPAIPAGPCLCRPPSRRRQGRRGRSSEEGRGQQGGFGAKKQSPSPAPSSKVTPCPRLALSGHHSPPSPLDPKRHLSPGRLSVSNAPANRAACHPSPATCPPGGHGRRPTVRGSGPGHLAPGPRGAATSFEHNRAGPGVSGSAWRPVVSPERIPGA